MQIKPTNEISRFTADFRDGTVTVGGETFPSGLFFVDAMNEYWKLYRGDDTEDFEIAAKLKVMRFNRDKVQDDLVLGYLDPVHAEKLYDDVRYYLTNITRAKPFCFLELEAERERCRRIFGAENVAAIAAYLRQRAVRNNDFSSNDRAYYALPEQNDMAQFRAGESRLQEFLRTIGFYDEMGQGMDNAREIGLRFIKALDAPTKRTEGNLMAMAMDCIKRYRPRGFTEFDRVMRVNVEYVPVPTSRNRKTFEVGRRMTFERFGDFLLADFFEGLHAGHYPLRCGVCKRYFLQISARRRKYCDGYVPGDPKGRSCEAFAARNNRLARELAADHPVKEPYSRRRGTIDKHFQRQKLTMAQAEAAKRHIENLLDRAMADNEYFRTSYEADMEQDAVYAAVGIEL